VELRTIWEGLLNDFHLVSRAAGPKSQLCLPKRLGYLSRSITMPHAAVPSSAAKRRMLMSFALGHFIFSTSLDNFRFVGRPTFLPALCTCALL
jgi:hypothetical protein